VILLDTSGLLAALDRRSAHHEAAAIALGESDAPRLLSPFVLAELDYLLATRVGPHAQPAPLEDVVAGAYQLEPFGPDDVRRALEVIERFSDLRIGLADASIVVLAERHGCAEILTLDERHFRALRHGGGDEPFRVIPADSH
jgi:predicted nucleic acid-binding protein